jgi:hypothetical protein
MALTLPFNAQNSKTIVFHRSLRARSALTASQWDDGFTPSRGVQCARESSETKMNPNSQTVARRVAGRITAVTTSPQKLPPYYHRIAHKAHSRITSPQRDTQPPYAPPGTAKRDPPQAHLLITYL